eukprot:g57148.t1
MTPLPEGSTTKFSRRVIKFRSEQAALAVASFEEARCMRESAIYAVKTIVGQPFPPFKYLPPVTKDVAVGALQDILGVTKEVAVKGVIGRLHRIGLTQTLA